MNFGTYVADAAPIPEAEERTIAGEELFFPGIAGSAGIVVTERTALQLSTLLAVVNVLSTDVAVLPLNVYRRRPDGGRDQVADDPRDEILSLSPDGEATAICWRQSWMCHAVLYGNGYAEIQRTQRGMPMALHLLNPETTCVERDSGGRLGYRIDGGRTLPAANVLHLAGIGFDGLNGFNCIRLLRQAIGVGLAEEGYTADFYANGSEPGGVIESPMKLTVDAQKNLRDSWEAKHRGIGNKHRVAVLEQGIKFNPISVDPEKAQLVESRRYQVLDVARPWRVPPHKIGDFSQAHLANIEASNLDYVMTALMCWLVAIEQQCLLKLFSRVERLAGYYVEHNVNALLRGDISSRFAAYSKALTDGWLNRDEVRAMENRTPLGEDGGGDKYLVQVNQTTLERIGEGPPVPVGIDGRPDFGGGTASALRFNPYHDTKTGQFDTGGGGGGGGGGGSGGGGGGGGSSGAMTEKDLADTHGAIGGAKAKGMDVGIKKGGPSNAAEAKALTRANAKGQHAVTVTQTPKVETVKRQDVTTHRFVDGGVGQKGGVGEIHSKTYPDTRKGKEGRWISQQKSAQTSPEKRSYKTRGQALRASKGHMTKEQAAYTEGAVSISKTVSRVVKSTLEDYAVGSQASKGWKVRFKVVTGGGHGG